MTNTTFYTVYYLIVYYFKYNLRPRRHSLALTAKGSSITDRNFITRMILKDIYWFTHISMYIQLSYFSFVCVLIVGHCSSYFISFIANVISLLSRCGLSTCIPVVLIYWKSLKCAWHACCRRTSESQTYCELHCVRYTSRSKIVIVSSKYSPKLYMWFVTTTQRRNER